MDPELQQLFEDSLQRFSAERYSHAQWLRYGEQPAGGLDREIHSEMAQLGWFELLRPGEDGSTARISDLLPLLLAAGEGLWREPLTQILGECTAVAYSADDPEVGNQLLDAWITGTALPVYAHRETGAGWGCQLPDTVAHETLTGYEISGEKPFMLYAAESNMLLVSAMQSDQSGPGIFLVATDAGGLRIDAFATVDGRRAARVILQDAPAELICSRGYVFEAAMLRGMLLSAAEAVGVMRGAVAATGYYLGERRQFGRPLATFQALQHRFVELHMLLRESEALLGDVADAYDRGLANLYKPVLQLRAQVSRAALQITQEAIQMHGGMGITRELRVGHYYQRALLLDSLYGSADWALEQLVAA